MKRLVILMLASSLVLLDSANPQDVSRPAPAPLWPRGAPGAVGSGPEDTPTISLYRPANAASTGAAFVVCPGGGYTRLADHEGHNVAVWLNGIGVTVFVLKYRLGPRYRHPAPLQDVTRAIRTVRARAKEWNVDPGRIGVIGFSAGGHLASTVATQFDTGTPAAADVVDRVSSRPDLAVLAYPVISMEEGIAHAGSRTNLLGPNPSADLVQALSTDRRVTSRTPPTFLFHTADDAGVLVENSLRFAAALRAAKVPYELHVFETGRHGVGLALDNPVLSAWPRLLESWLRARGFVK
jgi:acetyl esterase/lipase